jgi:tetratricopeptide (TPR) repeat protein
MASGQIAWQGWREGMTAEAAKPFIDEAIDCARETDDSMIPLLLFVSGRITLASGGSADTYVRLVKEGLSLLKSDGSGVGRAATLNASLSQAYGWAGMLNEALAANTAALQTISAIENFDHQFLGYSVEHWAKSLRGRILLRLGRFAEAEQCLDMMVKIEQTLHDPTVQYISHWGYVELAWCRDDAALAEQHALRVAEIAEKHGSPYLRVFALLCRGMAKSIAKDFASAARDFHQALQFVRQARAAMECEPEILASLADCYYQAGDSERAISLAKETIDLARQRSARLPECRACLTRGAALLASHGATQIHETEGLFRCADELIRVSGARIYEPLLANGRARISMLVS